MWTFAISSETCIDNKHRLKRVCDSLSHRGPDHQAFYLNNTNTTGLAHNTIPLYKTLSLLAISQCLIPIRLFRLSLMERFIMFPELRSQLISSGYSFLSNSDTEVLLNLYLAHGTDFVDKLNGIFAFAIWDSNLGQLWICRDAGVKPCTTHSPQANLYVLVNYTSFIRSRLFPV